MNLVCSVIKLNLTLTLFIGASLAAFAGHDTGRNVLTFAPVSGSPSPNGDGNAEITITDGTIAGGDDRWFTRGYVSGLQPYTRYTLVVQGRFVLPGSVSNDFSSIASFRTDGSGGGNFWNSFYILKRLGVAQIRRDGVPVLQATRAAGGIGTIATIPFINNDWNGGGWNDGGSWSR